MFRFISILCIGYFVYRVVQDNRPRQPVALIPDFGSTRRPRKSRPTNRR